MSHYETPQVHGHYLRLRFFADHNLTQLVKATSLYVQSINILREK